MLVLDFALQPIAVPLQCDNLLPLVEIALLQFQQVALLLLGFLQQSILLLQI